MESMFAVCIGIMVGLTGLAHAVWRSRRKVAVGVAQSRERDIQRDRFRGLYRMVATLSHLRFNRSVGPLDGDRVAVGGMAAQPGSSGLLR